ncbi:MAG TPA: hypothetical protein VN926_21430 [Bradyrhizobium sp.]|jgi:hypothetical protein|nr:hypothetical protein [Bradyrhizobium sp.]
MRKVEPASLAKGQLASGRPGDAPAELVCLALLLSLLVLAARIASIW